MVCGFTFGHSGREFPVAAIASPVLLQGPISSGRTAAEMALHSRRDSNPVAAKRLDHARNSLAVLQRCRCGNGNEARSGAQPIFSARHELGKSSLKSRASALTCAALCGVESIVRPRHVVLFMASAQHWADEMIASIRGKASCAVPKSRYAPHRPREHPPSLKCVSATAATAGPSAYTAELPPHRHALGWPRSMWETSAGLHAAAVAAPARRLPRAVSSTAGLAARHFISRSASFAPALHFAPALCRGAPGQYRPQRPPSRSAGANQDEVQPSEADQRETHVRRAARGTRSSTESSAEQSRWTVLDTARTSSSGN